MPTLAKPKHELTAREAKVIAQGIWLCCVFLAAITVGGLLTIAGSDPSRLTNSNLDALFWVSVAVFLVGIPAAWAIHTQCFKRYWHHGVVDPRGFIVASVLMWGVFTGLILVIATNTLLRDGLFPDFLMLMPPTVLLLLTYPSGWAMTHQAPRDKIDDEHELFHSSEDNEV
ncbi:MAG: hypothetical protein ACYTGQ_07880 [Planctomycetota bacterium]|jgi:hypothetical protein